MCINIGEENDLCCKRELIFRKRQAVSLAFTLLLNPRCVVCVYKKKKKSPEDALYECSSWGGAMYLCPQLLLPGDRVASLEREAGGEAEREWAAEARARAAAAAAGSSG